MGDMMIAVYYSCECVRNRTDGFMCGRAVVEPESLVAQPLTRIQGLCNDCHRIDRSGLSSFG
jgi:hypothetical protein